MDTIYCIRNDQTNKCYVGQTCNFHKRINQHFSNLRLNRHENSHLQNSYNKYGAEAFKYEIVEVVEGTSQEEIDKLEEKWISYFDSYKNGYNLTTGGSGTKGRIFSNEEKRTRSERMTGRGNHFYGKTHSEDIRNKLSASASERIGSLNAFYGKTHSSDWKEKRQGLYEAKQLAGWICPNRGVPKPKDAIERMKENMPMRREVIVDGIIYKSLSECYRELGLHRATIRMRASSENFPNYSFYEKG